MNILDLTHLPDTIGFWFYSGKYRLLFCTFLKVLQMDYILIICCREVVVHTTFKNKKLGEGWEAV